MQIGSSHGATKLLAEMFGRDKFRHRPWALRRKEKVAFSGWDDTRFPGKLRWEFWTNGVLSTSSWFPVAIFGCTIRGPSLVLYLRFRQMDMTGWVRCGEWVFWEAARRRERKMTATYERSGLQFLYPENWTLADDALDQIPRTIMLQSPTGAFWSVDIHPFSVDVDDLLRDTLAVMKEEYPEMESVDAEEEIGETTAKGRDLFFYCLDFVVQANVRALRVGHATYLLTYQGEDRDFEQLAPVFRAITTSLFSEKSFT